MILLTYILKKISLLNFNKNIFNYDIRYWDVSAANNMDNLFKDATYFNEDISNGMLLILLA